MSAPAPVLVNGMPAAAGLDPFDRGLAYGDGLFRTLRVMEGAPELWDRHMAALSEGCVRLSLPMPDPALLADEARALIGDATTGVLRLTVTRGPGGRGYRPPADPRPTRILSLHDLPPHLGAGREEGVRVRLCSTRLSHQPALAGIKHLNRLDHVLARGEWFDPAIAEGLMLAADGAVVCGTMSNLFLIKDGRLCVPEITGEGVAGVMRGVVLDHARAFGLAIEEGRFPLDAVLAADGAFLTNAVIGAWTIAALDAHPFARPPFVAEAAAAIEAARCDSRTRWRDGPSMSVRY